MGKKPVLGLVGLCVGLALSGCKTCGCGWGTKSGRSDRDPAVTQVRKDGQKATTDRTVAAKKGAPAQKKNPYDYPPDSYDVKQPGAEEAAEHYTDEHTPPLEKPTTRVTQPTSDPAGLKAGKGSEGGDEFATPGPQKWPAKKNDIVEVPPPPPPVSKGQPPVNQGVAVPVPSTQSTGLEGLPKELVPAAKGVLGDLPTTTKSAPYGDPDVTPTPLSVPAKGHGKKQDTAVPTTDEGPTGLETLPASERKDAPAEESTSAPELTPPPPPPPSK